MDKFNTYKLCQRCKSKFTNDNRRIQSWFNDDVICSGICSPLEKVILKKLGDRKYQFEDCGYIPKLEDIK